MGWALKIVIRCVWSRAALRAEVRWSDANPMLIQLQPCAKTQAELGQSCPSQTWEVTLALVYLRRATAYDAIRDFMT